MASKLTLWRKIGRFVTGLVVVAFFLPFFGVSCAGVDVVSMSGTDMVAGCKPGGMIAEGGMGGLGEGEKTPVPDVDIEPLAIIAFACAVIGFGLAWVKTRGALVGTLVVSIAGLGALGGLYFKVKSNLDDAVKTQLDKKEGGKGEPGERMASRAMESMSMDVGGRMGLWLSALGLISVAGLTGLALKEKPGAGGVGVGSAPPGGGHPPAGYPPAGYPPAGYPPQGPPSAG